MSGEAVDVSAYVSAEAETEITAAFRKHGLVSVRVIHEALQGRHEYGPLKLVRARMQAGKAGSA